MKKLFSVFIIGFSFLAFAHAEETANVIASVDTVPVEVGKHVAPGPRRC